MKVVLLILGLGVLFAPKKKPAVIIVDLGPTIH
jgi:hypothetical protein